MPPAKWKLQRIVELTKRLLDRQLDADRYSLASGSFGLIIRKSPLTSPAPHLAVFELATLVEHDGYIHSAPQ